MGVLGAGPVRRAALNHCGAPPCHRLRLTAPPCCSAGTFDLLVYTDTKSSVPAEWWVAAVRPAGPAAACCNPWSIFAGSRPRLCLQLLLDVQASSAGCQPCCDQQLPLAAHGTATPCAPSWEHCPGIAQALGLDFPAAQHPAAGTQCACARCRAAGAPRLLGAGGSCRSRPLPGSLLGRPPRCCREESDARVVKDAQDLRLRSFGTGVRGPPGAARLLPACCPCRPCCPAAPAAAAAAGVSKC
jgi:hypothetical protein